MKVHIKKPSSYFSFSRFYLIYLKIRYPDIHFDYKEDKFDLVVERVFDFLDDTLGDLIRAIPKRNRDPKIQIHDWDLWSLDYTLAKIILPSLIAFKQAEKHGIPFVDNKDVPKKFHGSTQAQYYSSNFDEVKDTARWNWVLDEMIWTFQQIIDDDYSSTFDENGKYCPEKLNAYQKRIENGLRLFGKYFRNLWD